MGNKYVSLVGSDANNGLGPDASHASNKPWATLEYAVDNMSDGDVLYVAPGIWRDVITIGVSPTGETIIRGDPLNTQGFKDSGGVLLAQGPVIVTQLLTDDVTASTNTVTIDLNSKSYITFENLWVESYGSTACFLIGSGSTHVTIRNCFLSSFANGDCVAMTSAANTTHTNLIERSALIAISGNAVSLTLTKTNVADYNAGITIRNCTLMSVSGYGVNAATTATATYYGGGVDIQNCSIYANRGVTTGTGFAASMTHKINVKNCLVIAPFCLFQGAGAAGDVMVEDYNFLLGASPRTTVTNTGGHDHATSSSTFDRAVRHDFGQAQLFGYANKSLFAPWSTSRTIGYGNDSTPTALTTDILNRVRPSGSGVAAASILASVGAHELHEYGTKDTGTKDAGDASLKLLGPGDHEFFIPVAAESTTISIKARYQSSTYGGTNYPQAILLDSEAFAGISTNTETKTATVAASDAWETLTFTAFTPSRKGVIRLRLVNRGSGADDVCWFDTMTIV